MTTLIVTILQSSIITSLILPKLYPSWDRGLGENIQARSESLFHDNKCWGIHWLWPWWPSSNKEIEVGSSLQHSGGMENSLLTTSLQYLARMWELFTCRYPMLDWPCSIVFLRSVYSHMASSIKPDLTTYPGSKNCHWFFFLPKLYLKSNSWSNPSYFSRAGQKLWNYSSLQLAHLTTMGSFVLSPCSLLSCTPSS